MRKAIVFFVTLALLMAISTSPVHAQVQLPHAFYGSVLIGGAPAEDGTLISATVDAATVKTNSQNPVATVDGSYGVNSLKLLVQGEDGAIPEGATIRFYVNGVEAEGVTATFQSGGGPTEMNLSVVAPEPEPGPTVAGPTYYYIRTNLFGIEKSYRIERDGELLRTIEATSGDGNLTMNIPEGTVALDKDSDRLETLEVTINETPPDPPEDAYIIELAYDFTPDGATFDPPITLTWSYDPDLPEGVAEEDLVVAYYDEATGEWVELDGVVDTENNLITASVAHFTTFAIIGSVPEEEEVVEEEPVGEEEEEEEITPAAFSVSSLSVLPAEVEPGEPVTITVSVSNTGGESGSYTVVLKIDGVKEAEETVTVAAGESQDVSFSVTREEADSYAVAVDGLSGSFTVVAPVVVPPAKPGINWPLIGGIIGGVIVVGLGIFFWMRRRAYY